MATDSLDTRPLVGKQSYTPYPVALGEFASLFKTEGVSQLSPVVGQSI